MLGCYTILRHIAPHINFLLQKSLVCSCLGSHCLAETLVFDEHYTVAYCDICTKHPGAISLFLTKHHYSYDSMGTSKICKVFVGRLMGFSKIKLLICDIREIYILQKLYICIRYFVKNMQCFLQQVRLCSLTFALASMCK